MGGTRGCQREKRKNPKWERGRREKGKKTELSKEELMAFWDKVTEKTPRAIRGKHQKGMTLIFTVATAKKEKKGRKERQEGRKPTQLGVQGEELAQMM